MPDELARRIPIETVDDARLEDLLTREWLVTNGLGGYASGTLAGVVTRRYHGLLVAALANPLGRTVMLNHLDERVARPDGTMVRLSGEEYSGGRLDLSALRVLGEFRLEMGLPVWTYDLGEGTLERRVIMPHRQNTVYVVYRLRGVSKPLRLTLRPAVHFRGYEARVSTPVPPGYGLTLAERHYVISSGGDKPALRLAIVDGDASFGAREEHLTEVYYRVEAARGYDAIGTLWTPGQLEITLEPDRPAALIASTEAYDVMSALSPVEAIASEHERRALLVASAARPLREGVGAELVLAADQFVITPRGRTVDTARAWAVGDEIRTIIAGYHWFTDWGRDTMISLEGLTLATGRHREAGAILRAFAHYVRDGLIPNMFPDGSNEGLYHTADATLWFFHAISRYLRATNHRAALTYLLPTLTSIIEHHRRGTRFGIGMDPDDALLREGEEGYQLTWMDAKVDDWVVTPRRGKAVEINALWYNALCLTSGWLRERGRERQAGELDALAARARASFNRRFWYEGGGYLYDVVDGPDGDSTELRPNQLFAISLDHPVLDRDRWAPVVNVVRDRLLTPYGLRSLAPGSPEYKPRYYGDLRARDAAYHQGTVWGWLIGPWVDAWLKVHPDDRVGARRFLTGLAGHLDDFGMGSIAEIFDAEPPYTARGCIAQAWSVAEELRCWLRTAPDHEHDS